MGRTHERGRFTSIIKDIMSEYIPYSERHEITDPFLAKLVDHIERVVGWDIDSVASHNGYASIASGNHKLYIYQERVAIAIQSTISLDMPIEIFQKEYTNLLSHYKK